VKFSIITPSFNTAKYIKDCLDSVAQQDGVEVEHIVQDAGSTDDTLNIVRQFPSVKLFSEADKGMSDGINRGVSKANGTWWMWLNADDYLMPGSLKTVSDAIERSPNTDVIYGDYLFVDAAGQTIKPARMFPFDRGMMIHYGCYIGSTATFFKKASTFDKGHLLNVRFKQAMDQEYFTRLALSGLRFTRAKGGPLASFRIHGENTSLRHAGARDMDAILSRQMQLAEGLAIRRKYGFSLSKDNVPMANGFSDAALWYYYRVKKVIIKILYGCYWN
jgi:Predicted glycosyltransferases